MENNTKVEGEGETYLKPNWMEEYKLGSCRGWILGIYLPVSKVHQSKQPRFCLLFVVEVVSRKAASVQAAGPVRGAILSVAD